MAQNGRRPDEIEVSFVFIPDDAEGPAPVPSGDMVRLRAQLVPRSTKHEGRPRRHGGEHHKQSEPSHVAPDSGE